MSAARPRILFVHNRPRTFVLFDRDLLRRHYQVTEVHACWPFNPLTIARAVASHDLVFGWFASWHMVVPLLAARLLHKPSLLIVGGYDVAQVPEIGYGLTLHAAAGWVSKLTVGLATQCVAFSTASRRDAVANARANSRRTDVVYLGVADVFGHLTPGPRERLALSVGDVSRSNLWRKGHEPFVRAAALLPNVRFVLVGPWLDDAAQWLKSIATANVTLTGAVDDADLRSFYQRAAVYVQASAHEGFGLSVAEAMLGGCMPVVTAAGALPEVVGDTGIYTQATPEEIAAAISCAMNSDESARRAARERILSCFPPAKREQQLLRIVDALLTTCH